MLCVFLLLCTTVSLSAGQISVLLKSSVSLECVPNDAPQLAGSTFTWSFMSLHTQHQETLGNQRRILSIKDMNHNHSGRYTCVQEGYKGEDRLRRRRTFTVNVEEPVAFEEWQVVRVEVGSNVMLPCRSTEDLSSTHSDSSPVVWKRETEDDAVPLNVVKKTKHEKETVKVPQRIFWDAIPEEQDWAIKITQTRKEDAGMYQCLIKNATQTLKVELQVQEPCRGHTAPWEACEDPDSRSWKKILQESLVEFSASLYSQLKGSNANGNLIFSPISIAVALYNLLLDQKLSEAFVNQSLEFYDNVPQKLTSESKQNVDLINRWVAEKTRNKITELIDDVDLSTSFVLLNAVYFNGQWKTVFEATNKKLKFTKFSGEIVEVPALFSSKYSLQMSYYSDLKVGKFSMTGKNSLYILVPNTPAEESFQQMENTLTPERINEMVAEINKLPVQTAEVTLPKLKLTANRQLEEMLRNLGLSDLFLKPNLCGMFPEETQVFISDVRHRAFLSISEKGVEAAAATSMSFARTFSSFNVLQPFVFILWSDEATAPLFMGKVIDP
ncbi:hypothetical protein DNTS_033992 [Danionella cerebrum]|uniref:Ig-like domain-containing protein n=1 Tax=Danionella cerebrum TaxID=2873325 RepID=A0A553RCG7_9TELE|nr:hypothetical protein DNTS_033992 [Danionella translucida]